MNGGAPSIAALAVVFCAVALLYASVGFGGGSTYTALLALCGFAAGVIPVVALSCNLIVAGGGSVIFARRGLIRPAQVGPFVLPAIPAAYLGGRLPVEPGLYFMLLAVSLMVAGAILLVRPAAADSVIRRCPIPVAAALGVLLGLLSGVVGIGGGVFLAPVLLLNRWATPRESAACASVFIALNSLAGLAGQLAKPGAAEALAWLPPLALAVLAGGQLGSRLGAGVWPSHLIRRGTAVLILLVSARLILRTP
jgi:uncharacterized protein